jgi:hypothetical protein
VADVSPKCHTVSLKDTGAHRKETRVGYDAPRSTALPTLAGTMMIDDERALSLDSPRVRGGLRLFNSPRHERPPQFQPRRRYPQGYYYKLDKQKENLSQTWCGRMREQDSFILKFVCVFFFFFVCSSVYVSDFNILGVLAVPPFSFLPFQHQQKKPNLIGGP